MTDIQRAVADLNDLLLAAARVTRWRPKSGVALGPEMQELAVDLENLRTTISGIARRRGTT